MMYFSFCLARCWASKMMYVAFGLARCWVLCSLLCIASGWRLLDILYIIITRKQLIYVLFCLSIVIQIFTCSTMVEETKKKFSRDYLTWTYEMDKVLLDVFVEHHNRGDQAQNGWKPHVYTAAIKAIRDKCGLHITKDKICSRMKSFDKPYGTISKILSQSGFGWDWVNNKLLMDIYEV